MILFIQYIPVFKFEINSVALPVLVIDTNNELLSKYKRQIPVFCCPLGFSVFLTIRFNFLSRASLLVFTPYTIVYILKDNM